MWNAGSGSGTGPNPSQPTFPNTAQNLPPNTQPHQDHQQRPPPHLESYPNYHPPHERASSFSQHHQQYPAFPQRHHHHHQQQQQQPLDVRISQRYHHNTPPPPPSHSRSVPPSLSDQYEQPAAIIPRRGSYPYLPLPPQAPSHTYPGQHSAPSSRLPHPPHSSTRQHSPHVSTSQSHSQHPSARQQHPNSYPEATGRVGTPTQPVLSPLYDQYTEPRGASYSSIPPYNPQALYYPNAHGHHVDHRYGSGPASGGGGYFHQPQQSTPPGSLGYDSSSIQQPYQQPHQRLNSGLSVSYSTQSERAATPPYIGHSSYPVVRPPPAMYTFEEHYVHQGHPSGTYRHTSPYPSTDLYSMPPHSQHRVSVQQQQQHHSDSLYRTGHHQDSTFSSMSTPQEPLQRPSDPISRLHPGHRPRHLTTTPSNSNTSLESAASAASRDLSGSNADTPLSFTAPPKKRKRQPSPPSLTLGPTRTTSVSAGASLLSPSTTNPLTPTTPTSTLPPPFQFPHSPNPATQVSSPFPPVQNLRVLSKECERCNGPLGDLVVYNFPKCASWVVGLRLKVVCGSCLVNPVNAGATKEIKEGDGSEKAKEAWELVQGPEGLDLVELEATGEGRVGEIQVRPISDSTFFSTATDGLPSSEVVVRSATNTLKSARSRSSSLSNIGFVNTTNNSSSSSSSTNTLPLPSSSQPTGSGRLAASGRYQANEDSVVECCVCRRVQGYGKVEILLCGSDPKGSGDGSKNGRWGDLGCELICVSCKLKYALCTECGGGGKFRTGKFRSLSLFLPHRKTCALSHLRIGNPQEHQVVVFDLSEPVDAEARWKRVLEECSAVFWDGVMNLLSSPEVMETSHPAPSPPVSTFADIQTYALRRFQNVQNIVNSLLFPSSSAPHQNYKVLIALVKVKDTHGRRPKSNLFKSLESVTALNTEPSSQPKRRKGKSARGTDNAKPTSTPKWDTHQVGGYCLAVLPPQNPHGSNTDALILDLVLRVPGIRRSGMESKMLLALLSRFEEQGRSDVTGFQMIMERWVHRWRFQMGKVGFVEEEDGTEEEEEEDESLKSSLRSARVGGVLLRLGVDELRQDEGR
ncbi:hypothetical protein HDV05_003112 [Chytridiales sp. JEL 0842]|nr:hypothetical protein HDV05_003112 [Chytridiales sp. JEL 0842]